jgi:hypothetical protein
MRDSYNDVVLTPTSNDSGIIKIRFEQRLIEKEEERQLQALGAHKINKKVCQIQKNRIH